MHEQDRPRPAGQAPGGLPVSAAWQARAEVLLRKRRVNVRTYPGKYFRKKFFRTIDRVYWACLEDYARSRGVAAYTLTDRLGLARSSTSRWSTKTNPPSADKFFACVLLVLRCELSAIPVPPRGDLQFRVVREQLEFLSDTFCPPPTSAMERVVFRALTHVMSLPDIGTLAPGARAGVPAKTKAPGTAVVRLRQSLHADFDPEDVARWLSSWGLPYTLFAMGHTRNWGLADA